MLLLDEDAYKQSPAMQVAFKQGQLAMLDEIREFANNILIKSKLNPYNVKDDYEEGQVYALNSMLEAVMACEQSLEKVRPEERFDA